MLISKGDKLSSSAECRIRTQKVSWTESPEDWMPADKPTELLRIKLKNLNSTARPYDHRAFSPLDTTAVLVPGQESWKYDSSSLSSVNPAGCCGHVLSN